MIFFTEYYAPYIKERREYENTTVFRKPTDGFDYFEVLGSSYENCSFVNCGMFYTAVLFVIFKKEVRTLEAGHLNSSRQKVHTLM
jgi:hypothetical protein